MLEEHILRVGFLRKPSVFFGGVGWVEELELSFKKLASWNPTGIKSMEKLYICLQLLDFLMVNV